MKQRLELTVKPNVKDTPGEQTSEKIYASLGKHIKCIFIEAYNIDPELSEEEMIILGNEVFSDPVAQQFSIGEPICRDSWRIGAGMLPGFTDNIGHTAAEAIMDRLSKCQGLLFQDMRPSWRG